ncbi:HTH_48 domain-containing protein [Trichonephila clavipes]|nr:HTH_48 domain-containing protein [Trichonephila clavipes]
MQIKDELNSVYGDSAPSFTTVKFREAEFKRSRKSLGDDERSGRLNTATTDENFTKVHQMVLDYHRIKKVYGSLATVTGSAYRDALQLSLLPRLEESEPDNLIWLQDVAPPHWHLSIRT